MKSAVRYLAVEDQGIDLPEVADVLQRIRIQDQDIGQLACFDGSNPVSYSQRVRGPLCC